MTPPTSQSQAAVAQPGPAQRLRMSYAEYLAWADEDVHAEWVNGPADLVVEVISDDSVSRDRADKFYEYQSAGVLEYWIIDPRHGYERVDFYVLDEKGRYRPIPVDADGCYRSMVVPGFWFEVAWVLSEEPPNVLQALSQIVGSEKVLAEGTQPGQPAGTVGG